MRYGKSEVNNNMSCPKEEHINMNKDPIQSKPTVPSVDTTPAVPLIPEDIDDCDENFPLITSVFSLAPVKENVKGDEAQKSTDKERTPENSSAERNGDGHASPQTGKAATKQNSPSEAPRPGPDRDNAPYYVGKGKLILPKPDDSRGTSSTVAFSKMMSISPKNNTYTMKVENLDKSVSTSGMLTRSAVNKISAQRSEIIPEQSNVVSHPIQTSPTKISVQPVNLNTIQLSNILGTQDKTGSFSNGGTSTSVLSSTSPLVQLIKRINTNTTAATAVTQGQGITIASSALHAPVMTQIQRPAVAGQVRMGRPVNIAPAPFAPAAANTVNPTRYVMVPKTAASTTAIQTSQATTQGTGNVQRVVMVPKQTNPGVKVSQGQLMYLIENKGADGKTYRLLIPDRTKLVSTPSPVTTTPQSPMTVVSTTNSVSPTQLVRIIPRPAGSTVAANKPVKTAVVTQPVSTPGTVTTVVKAAAPPVVKTSTIVQESTKIESMAKHTVTTTTVSPMMVELSTNSPPLSPTSTPEPGLITSPTSTPSTVQPLSTPPATPPVSPASSSDTTPCEDCLDPGLSPHEARIQKLKELLRKQEDAVDRLRQQRKKEVEDVRETAKLPCKRDSPFAVPLPPKKARLELYRSKCKDAPQTTNDGFLPNTDDHQFVKLVGLEKVVDKLKAKKILELQESQVD